ncbi:MAG: hypothetical protein ABEJ97_04670 [Halobellus sp.]
MPEYETYECSVCGESFTALPDSNAATGGYCSPACEIDGKDLA